MNELIAGGEDNGLCQEVSCQQFQLSMRTKERENIL